MLLPRRCPLCGALGAAPCPACRGALTAGRITLALPGLSSTTVPFVYESTLRDLLLGLKYRNRHDAVDFLAEQMAAVVPPAARAGAGYVTWVPTTTARRNERGFDQAELLARAVARRLRLPTRRVLARRRGEPQTGRSRHDRRRGPAFDARRPVRGAARVLLVDDVITTGATVGAAAAVLVAAGIGAVDAIAVAATPRRAEGLRGWPPSRFEPYGS